VVMELLADSTGSTAACLPSSRTPRISGTIMPATSNRWFHLLLISAVVMELLLGVPNLYAASR
jgi:hypothetical protein